MPTLAGSLLSECSFVLGITVNNTGLNGQPYQFTGMRSGAARTLSVHRTLECIHVLAQKKASTRSVSPKINLDEEEEDLLNGQLKHTCGYCGETMLEDVLDHICHDLVATPCKE
jgi:hypothetical protein